MTKWLLKWKWSIRTTKARMFFFLLFRYFDDQFCFDILYGQHFSKNISSPYVWIHVNQNEYFTPNIHRIIIEKEIEIIQENGKKKKGHRADQCADINCDTIKNNDNRMVQWILFKNNALWTQRGMETYSNEEKKNSNYSYWI